MATRAVTPSVPPKHSAQTSFPPKEEPKKEAESKESSKPLSKEPLATTDTAVSGSQTSVAVSEPEETGAQKFVRLTKDRMPKALKRIEMVGNLSAYDWTDSQRDKIFKDLEEAVKKAKARFQTNADDDSGESEYEI